MDQSSMFDNFDSFNSDDPETKKSISDLAKDYGKEKHSIKTAELALKLRKADLLKMEADLFAQMELAGMTSFATGGYSLSQRVDTYCSVDRSQQDKAFAWLEETGYSHLVTATVNARSLTSAIKEYAEESGEEPGADQGIKVNKVKRVSVRAK